MRATRNMNISDIPINKEKQKILSEGSMRIWFDWCTRIGFVRYHKRLMDDLQKVQDDNMHQFYIETQKEPRNWRINSQLNYETKITPNHSGHKVKIRKGSNSPAG